MPPISASAKLGGLLILLILISVSTQPWLVPCAITALAAALAGPLRITKTLLRAAVILPFSGLLAFSVWWSGDTQRAAILLARSYTSAVAVVTFSASTPVHQWAATLESWRVPSPLIQVLQFLHRYLFVISDEARRMRTAAKARGGFRFDAAIGAIGVLFARSWRRSEAVHMAMIARGFRGRFQ